MSQQPHNVQTTIETDHVMIETTVPNQKYAPVPQASPHRDNFPSKPTGREPEKFLCSYCNKTQFSKIDYKMGLGGWVWCLCCVWGVSCLPCCVESMQDAIHICPGCSNEVAKKKWLC